MSTLKIKKKIIHDMFILSKDLKKVGNFFGSVIIIQYILLNMVSGLFLTELRSWAEKHTSTFELLLFSFFIYNPLNLIVIGSRLALESITTTKFEVTRKLLITLHFKLTAWMIKPAEYIIFPLKMTLIALYFSSKIIFNSVSPQVEVRYLVAFYVIFDQVISFLFCLIKVTYLTGFKPQKGHFFAKIDGNFEQVMMVILPLNSLLSAMSMWFELKTTSYRWLVYAIRLVLNLVMTSTYFYEIPYYNQIAQTLIGNLIAFYVSFTCIFDATSEDFNLSLKIFAFAAPVYFFLYNIKLRKAYSHDNLDNRRAPRILKRILSEDYSYETVEEIFAEIGVIKAHFATRKKQRPIYQQIWKRMNAMKLRSEMGLHDLTNRIPISTNSTIRDSEDPDMDTSELIGGNDLQTEAALNYRKDLEETIERMIICHFTEAKVGSRVFGDNYAKYLKIVWMLKKEVVISELLRTIASMIKKGQSFRDLYFYELAKKEMESRFKGFYFKRYLYLRDRSEDSEARLQKMVKIDQKLKKINKIGVDLAYCFKLKNKMGMMTTSIYKFVELNMRYITVLRSPTKSYKDLMKFLKNLYQLKVKIKYEYFELHRIARTIEYIHLVPYFYFMARCINCHRSASNIFKLYKQRIAKTTGLINEKMLKITDINILNNGVIFKVESQSQNFGKLLNIYGDPEVRGFDTQQLIGQNMDILIMESHRRPHREACKNFAGQKLTHFLGENFKTYIKIPNSCYTYPVSMTIKMMPSSVDDFKFIVGVKFLKNDHRMYILLKEGGVVDSYSSNMKMLFNHPEDYLLQGIHIRELCPEITNQMSIQREKIGDNLKNYHHSDSDDDIARLKTYGESTNQRGTTVDDEKMDQTITEKRSSLDSLGVKTFSAVLTFRNSNSGRKHKRKFEVELINKSYSFTKFSYTVLMMNLNDDREMRKWLNTYTIKKGAKTGEHLLKDDIKANEATLISGARPSFMEGVSLKPRASLTPGASLGQRFKEERNQIKISISKAEIKDESCLVPYNEGPEPGSMVAQFASFQKMHNIEPKRGMTTLKSGVSSTGNKPVSEISSISNHHELKKEGDKPSFTQLAKMQKNDKNTSNRAITYSQRRMNLTPTVARRQNKRVSFGTPTHILPNRRHFLNSDQEIGEERRGFISQKSIYETVSGSFNFEDTLVPLDMQQGSSQLSIQEGKASRGSHSYNSMYEEGNEMEIMEGKDEEKSFDKILNLKNGNNIVPGGTGSVMNSLDIQTHKKYYVYEDSLKKKAFLTEMVILFILYVLAMGCSYTFNTYIRLSLEDHTSESSAKNSFFVRLGEFNAESQFLYNQILRAMTFGEGFITKNKYEKFESLEKMIKPLNFGNKSTKSANAEARPRIDVTDFEAYHKYKIHEQILKIDLIKCKIYDTLLIKDYLNKETNLLFSRSLNMSEFLIGGVEYETSLNYYQSIIHLYPDRATSIANLPIREFKKSTKNIDLLFFLKNALNVFLPGLDDYLELDYTDLKNSYIKFKNSLIYSGLIVLVGLMLILMVLSNVILCLQRSLFKYIFNGYMNITDMEFDEREKELSTLKSVYSGFLEKGCCNDFMGFYTVEVVTGSTLQKHRQNDQKAVRKYTDPWHCFNLLVIGAVISLFYMLQIGSSASMLTTLNHYTDEIIWTMNKEYIAENLLNYQLVLYNAILERVVLSNKTKIYDGQEIDKFLNEFDQKIRDDSELIFDLSRNDGDYQPFEQTKQFLTKIENSSLCEEIEILKSESGENETLCTLLDSGIAHKGLVQSYFRVTQYLRQIKTEVINNPNFDPKVMLNDPEFVEFQFTFENVYYPAFLSLIGTIFEKLDQMLNDQGSSDPMYDNNWFRSAVLFLNMIMMVYSFIKINAYMRRVCFSFQLISIFTVLRNISVKLRFLKVYKMNQKQL